MTVNRRTLEALLVTALLVSVVHYVDNTVNYDDFPTSPDVPAPPRWLVAAGWFIFTAALAFGYTAYRRDDLRAAALGLALYSGSGLVGFGHYTAADMTSEPVLRQAHVIADIALGIAILVVAVGLARRATEPRATA